MAKEFKGYKLPYSGADETSNEIGIVTDMIVNVKRSEDKILSTRLALEKRCSAYY